MDINKSVYVGRLAADVIFTPADESKPNSKARAVGRLIVNRPGGGYDTIPLVFWDKHAIAVAKFTKKGKEIGVEGRVKTEYIRSLTQDPSINKWELHVQVVSFGNDSSTAKKVQAELELSKMPPEIRAKYEEVRAYLENKDRQDFSEIPLPDPIT